MLLLPLLLLQATPVKAGRPAGIILSTPYLRIRVAQRAPYKPAQVSSTLSACLPAPLPVCPPACSYN